MFSNLPIISYGNGDSIEIDFYDNNEEEANNGVENNNEPAKSETSILNGQIELITEQITEKNIAEVSSTKTSHQEKRKYTVNSNIKKKKKVEKLPEEPQEDFINIYNYVISSESKIDHIVQSYFTKVKSILSEDLLEKFLLCLCNISENKKNSVSEVYSQLMKIFENHVDLLDEFLIFLKPQQAMEIGKFDDFVYIFRTIHFFIKSEGLHINKLLNTLEHHVSNASNSMENLKSSFASLFKGHPDLIATFNYLLLGNQLSTRNAEDFDTFTLDESEQYANFEKAQLKVHPVPEKSCASCICRCHKLPGRKLCIYCNLKFAKGSMHVYGDKTTRPAKIKFIGSKEDYHAQIDRLQLPENGTIYDVISSPTKVNVFKRTLCKKSIDPADTVIIDPDDDDNDDEIHLIEDDDGNLHDEEILIISDDEVDEISDDETGKQFESVKMPLVTQENLLLTNSSDLKEDKTIPSKDILINELKENSKLNNAAWTREEDKVILEAFQRNMMHTEQAFAEISNLMPSRSILSIQNRFTELIKFLEQVVDYADLNDGKVKLCQNK